MYDERIVADNFQFYKYGKNNYKMNTDNDLLKNLGELHTTELGVERIKKICL